MKRNKLRKGTGIYINEDFTKTHAEVLSSLRLKEPGRVEKAWSYEGRLFVRYRGSERNKQVHFSQYQDWLSKPWPIKETTTYAQKVSSSGASSRPPKHK
ncbi:hypothetical protein DPMN_026898 [Dreissena polymorpha]|uniref:Uncharacterized protein n=1 Tax=Dreissena polymorpha TaxID=45954 RepID=A0A9D4LU89_DREPO|nr:hypothetical protein DPMN_026898 [Dreissena polymorpha]